MKTIVNSGEKHSTVDTRKLGEKLDREQEEGAVTDGATCDGEGMGDAEGGDVTGGGGNGGEERQLFT